LKFTTNIRNKHKRGMRTIFGKMFWTNILTLVIVIVIIGVMLFGLLGNYVNDEKTDVLIRTADAISASTVNLLVSGNVSSNALEAFLIKQNYTSSIELMSSITESYICVIDSEGNIFSNSANLKALPSVPSRIVKLIQMGADVKRFDDFGGFFDSPVLVIGRPIRVSDQVIGGVLICMPTPMLNQAKYEITFLFLISAIITGIIAFFIAFLAAQKITAPLKQMNKITKLIANGDFSHTLQVETNDEIGELALNLNSMAQSLQKLEETRSSFISNVSHELRTPMTTIAGFIEGILDGTIPKENQEKYLGIVLSETKRLSKLVSDMLAVSKMNSQTEPLPMLPFDINEVIRLTIIRFEQVIEEKNLEIAAVFEEEICLVLGDKDSICRVITNLLDNAVKFSDPGRKVVFEVKNDPAIKNKVDISVYNEGLGISKDEADNIWERFYKTDKSRSKDKKGVGLGLYIVKNIIVAHNEKIDVESGVVEGEKEKYVKFTFTMTRATKV
jgi:signal transduction histidine kinase